MRRIPDSSRPARSGFTLVELLVVIGIIAILVSLTAAAVMRVRYKAIELQLRNDISQLSAAVQQFNTANNVDYFPSYIVLRNDYVTFPPTNPIEQESLKFLKRVWPRLQFPVKWFPDHVGATGQSTYTLTGDQCLVFFLGGIQQGGAAGVPPNCTGFSVNASNPTLLTGSRKQLFDFPSARLIASSNGPWVAFSFADTLGVPYAYFSNYGIDNGYNRYSAALGFSDCPALLPSGAYQADATGTRFYNKSSFQIICAGIDKQYGLAPTPGAGLFGGMWDAASGAPFSLTGNPGADDLSNFHDRAMGIGTN